MKKFIARLLRLYTERDLVTFAEYVMSEKRMNSKSEENRRLVTDPDLCNWKEALHVA